MDKKMTENAFFNIIYKLLNVLFPLITSAYVSRVLLAEGIGKVEYARNLSTIFVFIAALGIPAYGTKIIASSSISSDKESVNKNFSELLLMLIMSSVVCFTIYISIVMLVDKYSQDSSLYLATGIQILLVSSNIDWLYQGKEIYKYITYRSFVVKVCSIICIIIFVKTKDDYIIYALITSIAIAGNNIFNLIHSRKYVKFTLKGLSLSKHLAPIIFLLLSTIAGELYSKIDVLMIGHYCSENNVGYYSNALKAVNTVLTAVTAITAVYLPRLSLLAKENRNKFSDLAHEGLKILTFITIPCSIGIILVSDTFVFTMFGKDFSPASMVLCILSPLIIIKGIGDLINYQVVISVGKEKYFLITTVSAAVINIIMNYILIPVYQQNGAAIASVVSELIVNSGMLFFSSKIINLKLDVKFLISTVFASVILGVSVFLVRLIVEQQILQLILCILIGGIVYIVVSIFLKNPLLIILLGKIKERLKRGG